MGQGFKMSLRARGAAEILLYETIGESWSGGTTAKAFADEIKKLGDVRTIDVRINSYGGDVFDGLAIYNQLMMHPAKVTTIIDGVAASIASVIAMAGEEIHLAEAGFVMIHEAWGISIGNAHDMRAFAARLETLSGALADVYVARTRRSGAEVNKWMKAETWFGSADALKNGFATKIVENMKAAAKYDQNLFPFRNAPAALAERPGIAAARRRLAEQQSRLAMAKFPGLVVVDLEEARLQRLLEQSNKSTSWRR